MSPPSFFQCLCLNLNHYLRFCLSKHRFTRVSALPVLHVTSACLASQGIFRSVSPLFRIFRLVSLYCASVSLYGAFRSFGWLSYKLGLLSVFHPVSLFCSHFIPCCFFCSFFVMSRFIARLSSSLFLFRVFDHVSLFGASFISSRSIVCLSYYFTLLRIFHPGQLYCESVTWIRFMAYIYFRFSA